MRNLLAGTQMATLTLLAVACGSGGGDTAVPPTAGVTTSQTGFVPPTAPSARSDSQLFGLSASEWD